MGVLRHWYNGALAFGFWGHWYSSGDGACLVFYATGSTSSCFIPLVQRKRLEAFYDRGSTHFFRGSPREELYCCISHPKTDFGEKKNCIRRKPLMTQIYQKTCVSNKYWHCDDFFGLRRPVLQKTFYQKRATSIVERVPSPDVFVLCHCYSGGRRFLLFLCATGKAAVALAPCACNWHSGSALLLFVPPLAHQSAVTLALLFMWVCLWHSSCSCSYVTVPGGEDRSVLFLLMPLVQRQR